MVAGLATLVILASALDIAVPFLSRRLIDGVIASIQTPPPGGFRWILFAGAAIFSVTALTRVIRSFYNYQLFRTAAGIEDKVKSAAFANFVQLDTTYQKQVNTGEVVGALDRGGTAIFIVLYEIFGQNLVPPLVVFIGVVISLLARNGWIALAVVVPLPVYMLLVSRFGTRMQDREQLVTQAFEDVTKEAYDISSNVAVVKKFSQETQESARQRGLLSKARIQQFGAERLWALIENTQNCVSTLGRVVVICAGGYMVLTRRCSVGDYVLFIALQDMVYAPISQLSVILPKLRRNLSRCERLFEILDQHSTVPDQPGAMELGALRHSIEFRNVSFRYSGADRWTLQNVSFQVPAGCTVALIGKSGTGKSTLINLLQRAYDPQHGEILIDGVDIRTVTQRSLRKQIAVVPQEVDLFSRTIGENIAYGCKDVDLKEVEYAARVAQAHDFISRCDKGYDTNVGERGLSLSGGERQRIGIARAILRDPNILVMDEATSHLDTESEQLIQNATDKIISGRTSFVIAHRLSTVQRADIVVVFADGGIEAVGCHEQLRQTSPTYRRLYSVC
ncbi:MAG: ATP-binding cassette, subfamily bacterial [Bryobacterales bacterium]|jgi:ABC-type multidrug transport system fused ATPase/permease subunit|nr:ATP-binding cassette, subfamily bacterial [Bryobacterales bacterium]